MGNEKRIAWWIQEVKEAICAKKTAFGAWLTNKLFKQLRLRYSAAFKTGALLSNNFKEKSWEEIGQNLNTDHRSANEVLRKIIRRLRGKQTPAATFIEDTNGVLLKHRMGILHRWRKYFCEFLNPVTVPDLETSEKQFGEEIHLTEAEVSTVIKSWKAGKALVKIIFDSKR